MVNSLLLERMRIGSFNRRPSKWLGRTLFALVAMGPAYGLAQSAPPAGQTEEPAAPTSTPPAPDSQPAPSMPAPVYSPPPGVVEPEAPTASSESSTFSGSIAAGLGIPYGVLGGGFTLGIDYAQLIAGVGTSIYAGAGYSAGLRLHILDSSHSWRPHLTAVYGTTAIYKISGAVDLKGVLRGFAVYVGVDQDVGEPGGFFMTYGVGFITHEALPASVKNTLANYGEKEPSMGVPIKFLIAVGYRFGGK
jgi:hypothetical protein